MDIYENILRFPDIQQPSFPVNISYEDISIRSRKENGDYKSRKKNSYARKTFTLKWNAMSLIDYQKLENFYIDECETNVKIFLWKYPCVKSIYHNSSTILHNKSFIVRFVSLNVKILEHSYFTVEVILRQASLVEIDNIVQPEIPPPVVDIEYEGVPIVTEAGLYMLKQGRLDFVKSNDSITYSQLFINDAYKGCIIDNCIKLVSNTLSNNIRYHIENVFDYHSCYFICYWFNENTYLFSPDAVLSAAKLEGYKPGNSYSLEDAYLSCGEFYVVDGYVDDSYDGVEDYLTKVYSNTYTEGEGCGVLHHPFTELYDIVGLRVIKNKNYLDIYDYGQINLNDSYVLDANIDNGDLFTLTIETNDIIVRGNNNILSTVSLRGLIKSVVDNTTFPDRPDPVSHGYVSSHSPGEPDTYHEFRNDCVVDIYIRNSFIENKNNWSLCLTLSCGKGSTLSWTDELYGATNTCTYDYTYYINNHGVFQSSFVDHFVHNIKVKDLISWSDSSAWDNEFYDYSDINYNTSYELWYALRDRDYCSTPMYDEYKLSYPDVLQHMPLQNGYYYTEQFIDFTFNESENNDLDLTIVIYYPPTYEHKYVRSKIIKGMIYGFKHAIYEEVVTASGPPFNDYIITIPVCKRIIYSSSGEIIFTGYFSRESSIVFNYIDGYYILIVSDSVSLSSDGIPYYDDIPCFLNGVYICVDVNTYENFSSAYSKYNYDTPDNPFNPDFSNDNIDVATKCSFDFAPGFWKILSHDDCYNGVIYPSVNVIDLYDSMQEINVI